MSPRTPAQALESSVHRAVVILKPCWNPDHGCFNVPNNFNKTLAILFGINQPACCPGCQSAYHGNAQRRRSPQATACRCLCSSTEGKVTPRTGVPTFFEKVAQKLIM